MAGMRVYFASNRDYDAQKKEFGERFHADGPHFYRVGYAEMSKTSDHVDKGFRVDGIWVAPEKKANPKTGRDEVRGSDTVFAGLREQMVKDQKDVLVYIGGFANTFESNMQRAAQIATQYTIDPGASGQPYQPYVFVFSWPSNGRTLTWEYFSDRDDAAASGIAMARALKRFIDFLSTGGKRCNQRLHLVVHSMGNWALRHALVGIKALYDGPRLPVVFENAFLMAADEDDNVFEFDHKFGLLPQLARAIHVYHATNDGALVISDTTKFNPDRLGANGPRTIDGLNHRIVTIDCGRVSATEIAHVNHQYYRIREEVCADVRHVLAGRFDYNSIPGRRIVQHGRRYMIESRQ
jgi:esterase/lipase superfamily enzyme